MTKYPFQKGNYVVYGSSGVCLIEEVGNLSFGAHTECYYTLRPIADQSSQIFVPCENEKLASKLRFLLTKEEIEDAIHAHLASPIVWENDRKLRIAVFHDILAKGDPTLLLSLIRCILLKKNELEEDNRKLSLSDSETLQSAMRSIHSEFSFSLGLPATEISSYILSRLDSGALL